MNLKLSEPLVHVILWLIAFVITYSIRPMHMSPLEYGYGAMVIILGTGMLVNAGVFYMTAFRWLPLWQRLGVGLRSFLEPVAFILLTVVIKLTVLKVVAAWYYPDEPLPDDLVPILPVMSGFMSSLFIIFGANYQLARDRIEFERVRRELVHQRTASELAFLKTQVNPHFLFNTLNNLYGLAVREDAQATGDAILKLADMMRYMLHETGEEHLPLDREMDCLKNYVELQKLRIPKGKDVTIQLREIGDTSMERVPPMMMIPLVENAFKYGVSFKHPSEIVMTLGVEDGGVRFQVENTVHANHHNPEHKSGGVGLENLERRLGLIYPDGDYLRYEEKNGRFFADLFFPKTRDETEA